MRSPTIRELRDVANELGIPILGAFPGYLIYEALPHLIGQPYGEIVGTVTMLAGMGAAEWANLTGRLDIYKNPSSTII